MVKKRVAAANTRKSEKPDLCDAIHGTFTEGYGGTHVVNPITGRHIKVGGPTYISLMHGCLGCKRGMGECREIEERNGRVNPFTNRRLGKKSAVRTNLIRGCKSCAAQEMRDRLQILRTPPGPVRTARARNRWHESFKRYKHEIRRKLDTASAEQRETERRERAAALRASWGDLWDDEVLANLSDNLMGGRSLRGLLCPYVLPADEEDKLMPMVRRHIPNGGVAVMQSGQHYAALQLLHGDDGRFHVVYYEPFDSPAPLFTKPLRALLKNLNAGRRVPALNVVTLDWQRQAGPCGVYAAFAARALLHGIQGDEVRRHGPNDQQVGAAYEWIAENAPTYTSR